MACTLLGWGVGLPLSRLIHFLPRLLEASWRAPAEGPVAPREPPWPSWCDPVTSGRRGVQAVASGLYGLCAWRFGLDLSLIFALVFCSALIALAFIDARTSLLPDLLTLPLLWAGLLVSTVGGWTSVTHAVWGAALGYGGLWLVYHAFRLTTGKDGMGYGDFKLLAALGAWLGIGLVPGMLLMACLAGATVGVILRLAGRLAPDQALPFGPYLAGAGVVTLLFLADLTG